MSVNDQLTRIKNNVTASLSAVQEKGVSVPAGANSDNLPGLIAQISGGDATVEEVTNSAGGKSVYINAEAPKLPSGYTRLQYIQSTGSQYVDTGFKPNNNTRVVMDAQLLSSSAAGFYFGARASGYVDSFGVLFSSSAGALRSAYGSQNLSFATTNYTQKVHIDKNKTSCQLGSETLTHTSATFQNTYNMYLFASNEFGSVGSKAKMSLWGCQIWDNGTLVRDYVPCLNEGGVAGLYDMVNGVFYGDAAGGAFMAGPVVLEYELPEGYEELEYIQSTGSQYINTGVKGKSGLKMRMRTEWSTLSGDSNIFGALESGNRMFVQYSGGLLYAYGSYYTSSASIAANVAYDIEAEFSVGKQTLTVNGASVYSGTSSSSYSFSANVYLLALNLAGSAGLFAKNKLYACQIYEGGTMVRDYVPCKNASGTVGLWDAVNNTFTGDAAGVGFLAGPVVTPGVSKVVLEDEVLIDLTQDTVTPEGLISGFTAHNAMGQLIQGAASEGRGFATGAFTPTSNVTSMTISGLSFTPTKVVLTTTKEQTWIDYSKSCFYWAVYDPENSVSLLWRSYLDSDYGMMMIGQYPASTLNVTVSDGGFTMSSFSYGTYLYYPGNTTYRWYAIG